MKVAAIICEYNPFHNGHKYQIEQTKKELGVDYIIALMSGNYVQRGEPAIFEKSIRAKTALLCGADLVIELPLWYATASAQYFARGSIALLNALGIVDYLSFGSEEVDLSTLSNLCDFYVKNQEEIHGIMDDLRREGLSYPAARQEAIHRLSGQSSYGRLLEKPNNILAIEYLIALKKSHSQIKPHLVHRIHANYHDSLISSHIASATSIRNHLSLHHELDEISHVFPPACFSYLKTCKPVTNTLEDYKKLLFSRIIQEENLCQYFDVSKDISGRIYNCFDPSLSVNEFIQSCQTRSLPQSRISRCLLHLLFYMKNEHMTELKRNNYSLYFQILGFRKEASLLIRSIKEKKSWPMVQHCHDSIEQISPEKKEFLQLEKKANDIYHMLLASKGTPVTKNLQIIV